MSARTTYKKIQEKSVQKPYTTASTADSDTPRSGSYNTRSNMQVTTKNLLLTSDYHNTRVYYLQKIPYQSHTTLGNSESFTLDFNHTTNTNILKNTNKYLIL